MRYQQYKLKFYLNCRHAIYIDGNLGEIHPHTWEIVIHFAKQRDRFVPFGEIEKGLDQLMDAYQEKTLNEQAPFDKINPTLENCANYFRELITDFLNRDGWVLLMMEISETPSRSYVMSMIDEQELGKSQTINALTDMILEDVKNSKV